MVVERLTTMPGEFDLEEHLKKVKKLQDRPPVIGINFEIIKKEVSPTLDASIPDESITDSEKDEILNYFVNHEITKRILRKFYDDDHDDFKLHEGIATHLRDLIVEPKEKSKDRLFHSLRVKSSEDSQNVHLYYAYDPQQFYPQNYIPEMQYNLKKILVERLDYKLNILKLYNKSNLARIRENDPNIMRNPKRPDTPRDPIKNRIFRDIQIDLKKSLVFRFSRTYCEYILSKGFQRLNVGYSYKMSDDERLELMKILNYQGPAATHVVWGFPEDECESRLPFGLKADVEKRTRADNTLAYIRLHPRPYIFK